MVARHDLVTDPDIQQSLLTARRGEAFFERKLGELAFEDYDADSLLDGWSRRHVIAHVGYNARALTRLVQWAKTGVETPMYPSPDARCAEIARGATLSPTALLSLVEHAAISLSVEWRDLPDECWSHVIRTAQGRLVPVAETVWMRTREVWVHAVDLGNGARFADFPQPVLRRLLADIWASWEKRELATGFRLEPTDVADLSRGTGSIEVSGRLNDVVRWAAGRGSEPGSGLKLLRGGKRIDATPPRWL